VQLPSIHFAALALLCRPMNAKANMQAMIGAAHRKSISQIEEMEWKICAPAHAGRRVAAARFSKGISVFGIELARFVAQVPEREYVIHFGLITHEAKAP
jgi:hypothetical protein